MALETDIISKLGVGSGLDTTAIIQALTDADTKPQKDNIEKTKKSTKAKISAFAKVKSDLKDFQNILKQFKSAETSGFVGNSSDKTVATFTASGTDASSAVNSALTVTALAASHTITGPTYSATTSTVGSGTLTIDFGTWSADPTSGGGQSLSTNGQSQISVTASATTTVTQLRDMINAAATDSDNDGTPDVFASVVYTGSNYMLQLKSESGAANEMKVAATSNLATASGGVGYDYNATTSNMTQRVAGINSAFTLDGISMTRSSNSITDAYDGFTLALFSTSSDAINISSAVDLTDVDTIIGNYVFTYNEVVKSLNIMGNYDEADPENTGALNGDSTLRSIQSSLRSLSSKSIKGYENGPYYLSNLGIKTNRDGSLTFDSTSLTKNFNFNPESVKAFFRNELRTDNSDISISGFDFVNTVPGTYAFATDNSSTHSIGGISATKSGTTFSVASGDPTGINLSVANNATSGNVYYGKSFLTLAIDSLDGYLEFNSVIDRRVTNFNTSLDDLVDKEERLDSRIESLKMRYARQYAAMESSIAGFSETGDMLTSLLDTKND